jgi:hypothetical protein
MSPFLPADAVISPGRGRQIHRHRIWLAMHNIWSIFNETKSLSFPLLFRNGDHFGKGLATLSGHTITCHAPRLPEVEAPYHSREGEEPFFLAADLPTSALP